jgi:hypothetical protein
VLVLQEVAEGGAAERMVREGARRAGLRLYRHESWERPYLRRRPEATYSSTIHTKKDLKNMARLRRKLDAAVGGPVHLVDRSDDPAAIDELIRLEDAGYKARIGVAMTTAPGEPAYFREMCDRFRKAGRLQVYTLEGGGVVCAVILFVRARDGLMMLKVGYEERFARSSPGLQLHLDVIQHVHDETDARWLDVCTYPDNRTLLRMYPDRTRFASFMVPLGRNPADRLAVRAFMVARPLHKRLHDALAARRRGGRAVPGNARGDGTAPAGAPEPAAAPPGGEAADRVPVG